MAAAVQRVHFLERGAHPFAQRVGQGHGDAASGLAVEQRALADVAAEHFLQAHRLSAELKRVPIAVRRLPALVFDGEGRPEALAAGQAHAVGRAAELQHVAGAGNAQRRRKDPHPARNQQIAPTLKAVLVVRALVEQRAVGRVEIVRPKLLNVNERPLPAAERKVL